jgi:hypothetical protein
MPTRDCGRSAIGDHDRHDLVRRHGVDFTEA